MSQKRTQLVTGEFYHIIQRGVEERKIFLDDLDRLRFINSLIVFNDSNKTPWGMRAFWKQRATGSLIDYFPKNPFVEIHAFVLMDNHFHLLVKQIVDKGITRFMGKIAGFVYYFNKKYKRVGPLFQGRYKSVLMEDDNQIKTIFSYIHCNPLSVIEPEWKDKGVKNYEKAIEFLDNYNWSSFIDYAVRSNFPNLVKKYFFENLFNNKYKEEISRWILYKSRK